MVISTLISSSSNSRNGVKKKSFVVVLLLPTETPIWSYLVIYLLLYCQGDPLTLLLSQTNYCDKKQTYGGFYSQITLSTLHVVSIKLLALPISFGLSRAKLF